MATLGHHMAPVDATFGATHYLTLTRLHGKLNIYAKEKKYRQNPSCLLAKPMRSKEKP